MLKTLETAPFAFSIDKKSGSYIAARKMKDTGWILASHGPLSDIYRITSYNVCYTKLLR